MQPAPPPDQDDDVHDRPTDPCPPPDPEDSGAFVRSSGHAIVDCRAGVVRKLSWSDRLVPLESSELDEL